jgi:hypothetical protein
MYPYSSLVLLVIVSLLCGGSAGIWPFNTFASANIQVADQNVKQVVIIGMWEFLYVLMLVLISQS